MLWFKYGLSPKGSCVRSSFCWVALLVDGVEHLSGHLRRTGGIALEGIVGPWSLWLPPLQCDYFPTHVPIGMYSAV